MNLPPSSWLEKPSSPSWSRRVPCRDQQQYRSPSCKPCCVKPSSLRVVRALARRSFSHSLLAPLKHFPARVRPRNRFLSGRECYSGLAGYTNLCWGGGGCGACTPKIRTLHSFSAASSSPPKRTVSLPKGALIGVAPRPIYYCGTTARSTRPGNRDRPCWGESDRSGR